MFLLVELMVYQVVKKLPAVSGTPKTSMRFVRACNFDVGY
jgi:hypothetical protein